MISQRLKNIFVLSIPVFIAHGLEEYLTGFYNTDSHIKFIFGYLNTLPNPQATFLLFQIMLWLALIVFAFLISNGKWRLGLMVIPGLIYIYELHHIFKAFSVGKYYPGLITALVFPIIVFLFWKELLKNYKSRKLLA